MSNYKHDSDYSGEPGLMNALCGFVDLQMQSVWNHFSDSKTSAGHKHSMFYPCENKRIPHF